MFTRPALALLLLAVSGVLEPLSAQVNVTTYHSDTLRTGWNQHETVLNASNITSSSFGILAQVALDDQVDAQPLVFTTPGLTAVYVVTENNTVYEIDATTGAILLSVNLGAPVPQSSLPGKCRNNGVNVGITSTPVIDAATRIMYVVTYTLESGMPIYRIHALSLPTLSEVKVANTEITASHLLSDGTTVEMFNAGSQRQRAALLEANGNIYAGFTSFCDLSANNSRGWVLGWRKGTLAPLAANELTDTQTEAQTLTGRPNYYLSSIWMSGYGIAADLLGNLYFSTANSDEVRIDNIQESAVKLSANLTTVMDYFTPHTFATLDGSDNDFGSGGLMVLPNQPGPVPHLAVAAGKRGWMYILNRDAMGGFVLGGPDKPSSVFISVCWCGPSYFAGSDGIGRVVTSGGHTIETWKVNTANSVPLTLEAQQPIITPTKSVQDAGFFTSISSNGTQAGSAVIWAVIRPISSTTPNVFLYAFNAAAAADRLPQLYSAVAGTWPNLSANANIVPTVANGKVYVASYKLLTIFGPLAAGQTASFLPPGPLELNAGSPLQTASAQAAASNGEAQIFGTITSVDGPIITMKLRSGRPISVDLTGAINQFLSVTPLVGENVEVTGTLATNGSLFASVMLRAKAPETWGPDKP